jgi:hypothetical protein
VPNCRFVTTDDRVVQVSRGEADAIDLDQFFYRYPPVLRFADGSYLDGNEYVALRRDAVPYDAAKIVVWDWSDTDIQRESQGPERDAGTIQARVIRDLKTTDHEVIVDDDGPGEIADVVAVRVTTTDGRACVHVDLYHCKFSGDATPGSRIKDLYEVCGQAQKCISWMSSPERQTDMFTHLLRRDARRVAAGGPTRFELGTPDMLRTILEVSRTNPVLVRVFMVQPGVSRTSASPAQLELLSVTENHLMETYQLPLRIIASA